MTDKQPEALALADALHEAFAGSTKGTWKKGATTHHTVTDGWYKIAEFHHAADAQFCDTAHALAEPIATELRRLHQSEREGWRYANELEQDNASLCEQNTMLDQKLAELDQQTNPLTEMQYVKALGSLLSEIVCSRGTLRRIVETIEAAHGIGAKA